MKSGDPFRRNRFGRAVYMHSTTLQGIEDEVSPSEHAFLMRTTCHHKTVSQRREVCLAPLCSTKWAPRGMFFFKAILGPACSCWNRYSCDSALTTSIILHFFYTHRVTDSTKNVFGIPEYGNRSTTVRVRVSGRDYTCTTSSYSAGNVYLRWG